MKLKTPGSSTPPEEFAELARIYAEADAGVTAVGTGCNNRGVCCDFDKVDHTLFATNLEVDFLLATHGPPDRWEHSNQCPYQVDGLCTARRARPLGCRTYFCDPKGTEELHALYETGCTAIKRVASRRNAPFRYAPFLPQLPLPPRNGDGTL